MEKEDIHVPWNAIRAGSTCLIILCQRLGSPCVFRLQIRLQHQAFKLHRAWSIESGIDML